MKNNITGHNSPSFDINTSTYKIYGNTGCNEFTATFKISNDSLSIESINTNKISLSDSTEVLFLQALKKTTRYSIEQLQLTFYDGQEEVMTMRKVD